MSSKLGSLRRTRGGAGARVGAALFVCTALACTAPKPPAPPEHGSPADVAEYAEIDEGCPDILRQDRLPRYELDVAPRVWADLMAELAAGPIAHKAHKRFHPVAALRVGHELRTDASIRLKGDSSWRDAIRFDARPKAQFVVAFGHGEAASVTPFHGLRKIVFDMPRSDPTLLSERVAYAFMRTAGLPAPCANSAELVINGKPYGVFTAEEPHDRRLLERLFPGASTGALLAHGQRVAANASAYDGARVARLWAARDLAAMQRAGIDLDGSLAAWAAEAILNDADGYWGGDHNFYLYDHPRRGWLWLSDDLDAAFGWISMMQHPVYWWAGRTDAPPVPQPYLAVIGTPEGRGRFVAAIERLMRSYDVPRLQAWIDAWAAQLAGAVARDPHLPITVDDHRAAVAAMRAEVAERADYLRAFLACERNPTATTDRDRDGHAWCRDCDDSRPDVHPNAAETCGDRIDQDCDGVPDEGCATRR